MSKELIVTSNSRTTLSPTPRDLAATLFRRPRLVGASFGLLLLATMLFVLLSACYESHFMVLLRRGRYDPVVSSQPASPMDFTRPDITEEELNSEVDLEKQIVALRLQEHVYLIGHVPRADLAGYYRNSDLVVMTSKSEGIPVVLMEAMAHEKLVLAPAITGIPELVEHQRTGFLYQPGSLPDFVSAVRWIHSQKASLAGIRRAAAATIAASYNRQRNLHTFAEQFLTRISQSEGDHAHPVLQQIQLSV